MHKEEHSKTKTSFYRRLYVAHLIDSGVNSVPAICETTGMPRRTAQDTIIAMKELGIGVEFEGGTKNGAYRINEWGAINPSWIQKHLRHVIGVLQYPSINQ